MKRKDYTLLALLLCSLFAIGQKTETFESDITSGPTPWTNLDFYDDPDDFQFVIVSDRTGGLRPGVFEDAVKKINWLMPEFVMSVGDFIPGVTLNEDKLDEEWGEFQSIVEPLKMPFFYIPGNHDISNPVMRQRWVDMFGKAHYYYVYKDVLFLALDSNPEDAVTINEQQISYFKEILDKHQDVRWTMVFLHHPLWMYGEYAGGFTEIEQLLEGRKHTVIAGHWHRYMYMERNKTNYYVLASTGGGSALRGPRFGEFDHVTFVTMTDEGPSMANLQLSGIIPHNATTPEDLQLARTLTESVNLEQMTLLGDGEMFEEGNIYLTIDNPSAYPLQVNARFFHDHDISVDLAEIREVVEPGGQKVFKRKVTADKPKRLQATSPLQLDWTMGYELEDAEDLMLSGTTEITMRPSKIQAIQTVNPVFDGKLDVTAAVMQDDFVIRYTIDGSEPTDNSSVLDGPVQISKKYTDFKVRVFDAEGFGSATQTKTYRKIAKGEGLRFSYYDGNWRKLPDFTELTPVNAGVVDSFDPRSLKTSDDHFALRYEGAIDIKKSGEYTFYTTSDDGSMLFVNDEMVVDNDGDHGPTTKSGKIKLSKGKYPFRIDYFENIGGELLVVEYKGPGMDRQEVPFEVFSN